MEIIYLTLILAIAFFIPLLTQFIGIRFVLKRKDISYFNGYLLKRLILALFVSTTLFIVYFGGSWITGKESYLGVILYTAFGLILTSISWILIFRSKTNSISFSDSLKSSILSILLVSLPFLDSFKGNLPSKTEFLVHSKEFKEVFNSTFIDYKLRKILDKTSKKELVFQYSFCDGNNFASNYNSIIEVYKLEEKIRFDKKLPVCALKDENFCSLFDFENNFNLLDSTELNKNYLTFNVGHSNNCIYSKLNPIQLNWSKGSYIANETEDPSGGYTYTDILVFDDQSSINIHRKIWKKLAIRTK